MTSQIDSTIPVQGNPTTASVRGNFLTAAAEITALQGATDGAPFLAIAGGTMTGPMYLANDPTDSRMPVTLGYAQANFGAPGGQPAVPEAPADGVLYGRHNGAWSQAAAIADINAAIAAAVVPASETVAGIAMVATTAQVTAGTDNAAFVSSLKLQQRLAAALAGYVPTTGNSSIVGSITLAPTAANASATLTLNHPDAGGQSAIIAQSGGSPTWSIALGDAAHNNNYVVSRSIGPLAGPMMTLEQATGIANFNGLNVGMDSAPGVSAALLLAGPVNPASASQDVVMIAQKRLTTPVSGFYRDGPLIALKGPINPNNPLGVELYAGSVGQGYKTLIFNPNGNVTLPGNLFVNGSDVLFAQGLGGNANGPSLHFDITNHVYRLGPNNGQFLFVDYNNTQVMTLNSAGVLTMNILGGQIRPNGTTSVQTDNQWWCGLPSPNAWYGVAAYVFQTQSDARHKTNVADVPDDCLAIVGSISPKRYELAAGPPEDEGRIHWGFIAQEVGEAMDAAGHNFTGAHFITDEGWHSLDYGQMTAVLWAAVKQLAARVGAL